MIPCSPHFMHRDSISCRGRDSATSLSASAVASEASLEGAVCSSAWAAMEPMAGNRSSLTVFMMEGRRRDVNYLPVTRTFNFDLTVYTFIELFMSFLQFTSMTC